MLPSEIDVKAFPKDGKLWVEWTAPPKSVLGYIIEWCANSDSQGCEVEWQREPSTVNGTFLRGKTIWINPSFLKKSIDLFSVLYFK